MFDVYFVRINICILVCHFVWLARSQNIFPHEFLLLQVTSCMPQTPWAVHRMILVPQIVRKSIQGPASRIILFFLPRSWCAYDIFNPLAFLSDTQNIFSSLVRAAADSQMYCDVCTCVLLLIPNIELGFKTSTSCNYFLPFIKYGS